LFKFGVTVLYALYWCGNFENSTPIESSSRFCEGMINQNKSHHELIIIDNIHFNVQAVTGGGRPQHSVPRRPYNSIEAVKQAPHNWSLQLSLEAFRWHCTRIRLLDTDNDEAWVVVLNVHEKPIKANFCCCTKLDCKYFAQHLHHSSTCCLEWIVKLAVLVLLLGWKKLNYRFLAMKWNETE